MTDNKVKEAWTSLYLKDVVGDNYEWIQILPQQESNETLGKLESDNAVVMLALGVSFLVIVAGLILLFMCSKKKESKWSFQEKTDSYEWQWQTSS